MLYTSSSKHGHLPGPGEKTSHLDGWQYLCCRTGTHNPLNFPFSGENHLQTTSTEMYWNVKCKIVVLGWPSAFLGIYFGFISLFNKLKDTITPRIERLSNAIPDLPLAHVLINTINYLKHGVFFWRAVFLLFYSVLGFDTHWCLILNASVCQHGGPIFCWWKPDRSFQTGFTNYTKAAVAAHKTSHRGHWWLTSSLSPPSPLKMVTAPQRQSFQVRHKPSTAGPPRPAAYTTPTRKWQVNHGAELKLAACLATEEQS